MTDSTPSPTPPDEPRPNRRRSRALGRIALVLLAAILGVGYLIRDLPRRLLEAELSKQLDATVSLGGWKMVSEDHWELYNLRVKPNSVPLGMVLEVPTARIEGRAGEIADGVLQSLVLESSKLSIRLPRADDPPAAEAKPPSNSPLIDDLQIPKMAIFLCAELVGFRCEEPVSADPFQLDAHFRQIGIQAQGQLSLRAESLDLHTTQGSSAKPGFQGELHGLDVTAELGLEMWSLAAAVDNFWISDPDTELRIGGARWQGSANLDSPQGPLPVTQTASLESGLLATAGRKLRLPAIRWQALESAAPDSDSSSGSESVSLTMESDLWRSGRVDLEAKGVDVNGEGDGQESSISVELQRAELGALLQLDVSQDQPPSPLLDGTADLTLRLTQRPEQPLQWSMAVALNPRALNLAGPETIELSFAPSASISFEAEGQGLPGGSFSATVAGSARLPKVEGTPLSTIPGETWPVQLKWQASLDQDQLQVDSFDLRTGLATCTGNAQHAWHPADHPAQPTALPVAQAPTSHVGWQCSGQVAAALAAFAPSLPLPTGSNPWKAKGRARWKDTSPQADGRVEFSVESIVPAQGLTLSDVHLDSRFRADPRQLRLFETALSLNAGSQDLAPVRIRSEGELTTSLDSPGEHFSWDFKILELTTEGDSPEQRTSLGRLDTKGEARPGHLKASVELDSPSPAPWLQWMSPMLPTEARTLDTRGSLSFKGQLQQDSGGWSLSGPLLGRGLGLATEDGSRVLEGLDADSRLALGWRSREQGGHRLDVELDGQAGGFLMLWHTLFSDFSDLSTIYTLRASAAAADYSELSTSPWKVDAKIEPARGPRVDLSADLRPKDGSGDFGLQIAAEDLESLYRHFLVRLQDDPPTLKSLTGTARADLRGSFKAQTDGLDWNVQGRLQLKDTHLTTESIDLRRMDLDFPIDLQHSRVDGQAVWQGEQARGSFRLGRSTVGEIQLPLIESELDVRADSVTLSRPLEIDFLGGTLEMSRLTLRELARPSRFAETALSMRGLSLEKLTADSGLPVLEGRLDGELPKVTVAGQKLRVFGGGTLKLLGGEVEIRDISGSEIFTPFPELKLSADIRRLSLEKLTERLDFGKVTGLLSGQIDDCELFRGVPTAFRASFRTVPEKGISQTVDVKAVKNLTILGTGQGSNIFDQGIQRFLSSYRYSALGVDVTLRSDVLLLKGLERRGERELFLKGGFPFGIDIVNARPGQTVSFQTMVGRLKSLDFDRATFDGQ